MAMKKILIWGCGMTSTKDWPMYRKMSSSEVNAAIRIEEAIRREAGFHFNSEVVEYLFNLVLPMEKR